MKPFPLNAEFLAAARRIVWFEPPEVALAMPERFMAYALAYGTIDDARLLLRFCGGKSVLPAILDAAPPGILDARSWRFWNIFAGRTEVPEQAKRRID